MSFREPVVQHITSIVKQSSGSSVARAFAFGGGLAYALPNGFWHHTPLILLNPFAYASYQVFVSQKQVISWCKETVNEFR